MDLIQRINGTRFLGREFLTWLWFRSEAQEGLFTIGDRPFELWFDAKLTLSTHGELKEENVIHSESPTETEEARVSLQSGKQVKEARVRLVADQKQWGATLKADDMSVSGLKIPALLSREEDEKLYERFYLLEEFEDFFDRLFANFLQLRLDDDAWSQEVSEIRTWVYPMG
jgi:hypothetical protein